MKSIMCCLFVVGGTTVSGLAQENYASPPAMLRASEILPEDWRRGANFSVEEGVLNDGLFNTYQVETDYGPMTVESTVLLAKRVGELRVMTEIGKLKKTDAFTEALKSAGKAPLKAVESLIDEPVDTVKSMGTGLGRWFKDVGRSITSDDPHQPNVLDTVVGQAPVRRQFAYEFKVDPYTSYEPLSEELDELAWAAAGGGFTIKAAFGQVGGGLGSALSLSGTAEGMRSLVRDKSPAELNTLIKERLGELGVSDAAVERFVACEAFNPQERTLFVGEVAAMDGVAGREVLFVSAATAPDEAVALYMRVRAQVMRSYAEKAEVERVVAAGSVPFLQTADGDVVGILPLDHVLWTQTLDERLAAIEADLSRMTGVNRNVLLILGTVDAVAGEAMAKRGWNVLDRQFQRFRSPDAP